MIPFFPRISRTPDFCPYCNRTIEAEQVKRNLLERLLYKSYAKFKCMNCFRSFLRAR